MAPIYHAAAHGFKRRKPSKPKKAQKALQAQKSFKLIFKPCKLLEPCKPPKGVFKMIQIQNAFWI